MNFGRNFELSKHFRRKNFWGNPGRNSIRNPRLNFGCNLRWKFMRNPRKNSCQKILQQSLRALFELFLQEFRQEWSSSKSSSRCSKYSGNFLSFFIKFFFSFNNLSRYSSKICTHSTKEFLRVLFGIFLKKCFQKANKKLWC